MESNAACQIDQIEGQREAPATFPDFERMFIDQHAPLDDKILPRIDYKSCSSVRLYKSTLPNSIA